MRHSESCPDYPLVALVGGELEDQAQRVRWRRFVFTGSLAAGDCIEMEFQHYFISELNKS